MMRFSEPIENSKYNVRKCPITVQLRSLESNCIVNPLLSIMRVSNSDFRRKLM